MTTSLPRRTSAILLFVSLFAVSIVGHPGNAFAITTSSTGTIVTPVTPTTPADPTSPIAPTNPAPPVQPVSPGSGSTTPVTPVTNPTNPTCPTNPTNPTLPTMGLGFDGSASGLFDLSVAFNASTTCPGSNTGTTTTSGGGTGGGGTGTTTTSGGGTGTTTDTGGGNGGTGSGGTGTTTASTTDTGGGGGSTSSGGGGGGGGGGTSGVSGSGGGGGGGTSGVSGSGGGGGGGSSGSSGGSVLGASCTLINSYLRQSQVNDPTDVMTLKSLLNREMGLSLPVDSVFDDATTAAVNSFQVKYWQNVLLPWVPFGLPTDHTPTGYVYKTTRWEANSILCPGLDAPQPVLP